MYIINIKCKKKIVNFLLIKKHKNGKISINFKNKIYLINKK